MKLRLNILIIASIIFSLTALLYAQSNPENFSKMVFQYSEWGTSCNGLTCRIGYNLEDTQKITVNFQIKNDSKLEQSSPLNIADFNLQITPYSQYVDFNEYDFNWTYDSLRHRNNGDKTSVIRIKAADTLNAFTKLDYQLFDRDTIYLLSISTKPQIREILKRPQKLDTQIGRSPQVLPETNNRDVVGNLDKPKPVCEPMHISYELESEHIACKIKGKPSHLYSGVELINLLKGNHFQSKFANEELIYRGKKNVGNLVNAILASDYVGTQRIFETLDRMSGDAPVQGIVRIYPSLKPADKVSAGKILVKHSDTLWPVIYKELLFCHDNKLVSDIIRKFEEFKFTKALPSLKKLVSVTDNWDNYSMGSSAILKLTGKYPDSTTIQKLDSLLNDCVEITTIEKSKILLDSISLENTWPFVFDKYMRTRVIGLARFGSCLAVQRFNALEVMKRYGSEINPQIDVLLRSNDNYGPCYDAAVVLIVVLDKSSKFKDHNINQNDYERARGQLESYRRIIDWSIKRNNE